jgi:aspartokinase-like uncharacterized kinase
MTPTAPIPAAPNAAPLRIIKLGGSLLDWSELPRCFRRWLAQQSPAANVIIGGGGPLVDGLRTIDRVHRLSLKSSHWLAIRAMSLTAQLTAELFPEAQLVGSPEQIQRGSTSPLQILEVEPLLRAEQGSANELPCSWDVTSDSIAAHVAHTLGAAELVLLKSTLPEIDQRGEPNRIAPKLAGYVDEYFATAARGLHVRAVSLRESPFQEIPLTV